MMSALYINMSIFRRAYGFPSNIKHETSDNTTNSSQSPSPLAHLSLPAASRHTTRPHSILHTGALYICMSYYVAAYVCHTMWPHTTHMSAYYTYVLMLYVFQCYLCVLILYFCWRISPCTKPFQGRCSASNISCSYRFSSRFSQKFS